MRGWGVARDGYIQLGRNEEHSRELKQKPQEEDDDENKCVEISRLEYVPFLVTSSSSPDICFRSCEIMTIAKIKLNMLRKL